MTGSRAPIVLQDAADPRLVDYVGLTDVALRTRIEPESGLYLAESEKVIRRALSVGHQPRSLLLAERWLEPMADLVSRFQDLGAPVFTGVPSVIESVTGFHVHRGAIASMHRPVLAPPGDLIAGALAAAARPETGPETGSEAGSETRPDAGSETRPDAGSGAVGGRRPRIAIFEDIVDHTNLGAAFRSCAALGVDAVLVTPRSADPLYRRAVRVSMGTVFQVPWTRLTSWPADLEIVRAAGFTTVALGLTDGALDLDEVTSRYPGPLALIFGTEGDGLKPATLAAADVVCRIPMSGGVDSLNVAAAAAVAFYATR
jgi:tRNA G18 (ribose-2'-O)-methylase SpoU